MLFLLFSTALASQPRTADRPSETCSGTETDPTEIGSGTTEDPWLICTSEQLAGLADHPDGSFKLGADIDLEGTPAGAGSGCALFPTEGGFTGHFDGDGYTVSNHRSTRGVFACINGGTVEDLHLDNVTIHGDGYAVGGLVDFADSAYISNVTVTGTVTNKDNGVAGIVGVAYDSTLERVGFEGDISGTNNSGGVAGILVRSDASDCYAYGNVEGTVNIGGIIGNIISVGQVSEVRRCYAATNVSDLGVTSNPKVGTAVGITSGTVHFGGEGEESLDTVFALASGDKPLIGSTSKYIGSMISATRSILLDPSSYERAGWDLDTVWNAPTATTVPTLR